jgi:hypothetical protein
MSAPLIGHDGSVLAADLNHPAVAAALTTAADLLGMELVFIGGLTDEEFTFERVVGEWPGVEEGARLARSDSFCHRLLAGAPSATWDAANDPAYADVPARAQFGITSYVGVPVRDGAGRVVATLCGIDHRPVPVEDDTLRVLRTLAHVVEAHLGGSESAVIRRTTHGWRVGTDEEDELTSAMVLADLLTGDVEPGARPPRPQGELDETERLRTAVAQLEHALAARVVVEQAIGVLAERLKLPPRVAFDRLRRAARTRGWKVHDVARITVASATDPTVPLPPELARGVPPARPR